MIALTRILGFALQLFENGLCTNLTRFYGGSISVSLLFSLKYLYALVFKQQSNTVSLSRYCQVAGEDPDDHSNILDCFPQKNARKKRQHRK